MVLAQETIKKAAECIEAEEHNKELIATCQKLRAELEALREAAFNLHNWDVAGRNLDPIFHKYKNCNLDTLMNALRHAAYIPTVDYKRGAGSPEGKSPENKGA